MFPGNAPTPPFFLASEATVACLKRRITRIEKLDTPSQSSLPWRFGIAEIDTYLPHGLKRAGLHEIAPATHADMGAALSFALGLLEILPTDDLPRKPVLWCQSADARREFGRPYGPGIQRHGLAPEHLLLLAARRDSDVLWALEEAVRSRALAAVLGEIKDASFLASRRLALATAEAGLPVLLIAAKPAGASAAHSRWWIESLVGPADPWDADAPGGPAWHAELHRVREGTPGKFDLEWHDETRHFRLAAAMANRPNAACGEERRAL